MQRGEVGDIRYYALNCGEKLPSWVATEKRHAVKKNKETRDKLNIIHEFNMPDLSTRVRMSPDQSYILVTGMYKPRVRCYETSNLSIKFERCMDSEVITFDVASKSYEKLVFLQEDRYIELHDKAGRLDRFRIPFFGRDICIDQGSAMLFCVGNRPDIARFSLDMGQFLPPLTTQASEINACVYNDNFYYTAVGTADGTVETWDPRVRNKIATYDLSYGSLRLNKGELPSVSSLQFNSSGLGMAVGTHTGHTLLYDIRGGRPLTTLSNYNQPVVKTAFHRDWVLTMSSTALHLWPQSAGDVSSPYLSLRSETRLTDFCAVKDSGLLFLTGDTQLVKVFYVPTVGPSPRWCHYLDGLINELEESPDETVYDQYKFVTEEELRKLRATHLIGTNFLMAHSHGFYIKLSFYYELKSIVDRDNLLRKDKKKLVTEKIAQMRTDLKTLEPPPDHNQQAPAARFSQDSRANLFTDFGEDEEPLDFSEDKASRLANFKSQHAEEVPQVESKKNKVRKHKGGKRPNKRK